MSATTLNAAPRAPRNPFALFVGAATCAFAGVWMSTPLAAILLTEAGVSPALVGLYAAMVWGSALATAPATPWIAGLVGGAFALHRIAGGLAILGLVGLGFNPPLWLWFVFGAMLGVGSCLTWTTADAIAAALAPEGQEGRSLGLYQTFVSAAIGGGPAVLLITGVTPSAFFVSAGILALGLVLGAALRDPPGTMPRRMRLTFDRLRPVLWVLAAPAGAAALCGALEAAAGAVFPVQGLALGLTAGAAAAIVIASGFGNVLAQYPVGWVSDRLGPHRALLGCGIAVAAASLLWPLLAPGWGIWPVLAIWGGAAGAIYTLGMVRAVQRFAGPTRALGMAGLNTAYLAGGALGAPAAGLALETLPGWGLPVALAVLALAGSLALARAALRHGH
ncbi:MFS transporter [Roseococcus suduntuyensis]|uniref:MFS family permease n=1 Tax=Roseococcus suduntuyensis TaxID=455361 RepID=A0A840A7W5_9PROT|nr:MFS transporter [Roseococcus suduntuyensis]MBB3896626.1 MFS family permease [Roseococcus suduntuyensis]